MSVNYTPNSIDPVNAPSDTPMFAPVPSWERNRKRRGFGGKTRATASALPATETPRNMTDDGKGAGFAPTPGFATRRQASRSPVTPLLIAAGIIAVGGLGAAGWYASQPHDTGMASLTPGAESASLPVPASSDMALNTAPTRAPEPPVAATPSTASAASEAPRTATRVASASPSRVRAAAAPASAMDAGVNTSATLPDAPQPYSGAAVAPAAPADIAPAPVEAAPAPVSPTPEAPAPAPAAPEAAAPAAATPPIATPPQ